MTPEAIGRQSASPFQVEDVDDECTVVGGWCPLGLGYPPDTVKLLKLLEEKAPWILTGGPPPPEPTPEERLRAQEEGIAQLLAQGLAVPPNYLQVKREEAKRARQALDAAAAVRPTPPEQSR
jgi:hypothetical protein